MLECWVPKFAATTGDPFPGRRCHKPAHQEISRVSNQKRNEKGSLYNEGNFRMAMMFLFSSPPTEYTNVPRRFEPCWKKDLNSVSWMLIFHLDSGSRKSLLDLLLSYWLQVSFKSIQVQPIPPFFHGGWWNSGNNSFLKEWSYGTQIWSTAVTETLMIQSWRGCTPSLC